MGLSVGKDDQVWSGWSSEVNWTQLRSSRIKRDQRVSGQLIRVKWGLLGNVMIGVVYS